MTSRKLGFGERRQASGNIIFVPEVSQETTGGEGGCTTNWDGFRSLHKNMEVKAVRRSAKAETIWKKESAGQWRKLLQKKTVLSQPKKKYGNIGFLAPHRRHIRHASIVGCDNYHEHVVLSFVNRNQG